jgi:acetoin:2,6-dichlorophenolindophenol oxidoreductase subunit alpha
MVTKSKKKPRRNAAAKGKPAPAPLQPANGSAPPASNHEILRQMYAAMLKCRIMEGRARHENAMVGYNVTPGHEAVVIGASIDLKPEDTVAASSHNLTALIAMGASLKSWLKETATNDSAESRASVISCRCAVSGSISTAAFFADPFNLATGVALAHKLEKKTNVVVAFWDEDAASLEASQEALKFASVHKLPILYVTRGGTLEEMGNRRHSALEEFSFVAKDYGFPSILVDGNDVVAVWRAAQESVHRARNGAGPTLIECQTEATSFEDPLEHMRHYMTRRGAWDDTWKHQVVAQISAEIEAAAGSR